MSRPFRATFILGLVALAAGLSAVGGWRYARASAPVNGPIILISIDALRADHLPVYGYRHVRTPSIDALAADGVVFDRAYSHAPETLPAHVSLLTGRLPFETGVRDNTGFVVPEDGRPLAEMLRDRGFATGAVVSSYELRRATGLSRGFSFFDDEMDASEPDAEVGSLRRSGEASEQIAEQWLDKENTSRLFLFLHIDEPHAPRELRGRATGDTYDEGVARADAAVGRLIHYLKAHQLYDRSTIILVSDHGEGLGDHGEQEHGLFVYDEVLRVPLIVKQAAGEGAGRRVAQAVQHIDLVPTILDLAKAPSVGGLPGRSLTAVLEGRAELPRRMIYSESLYSRYHFGWSELTTITDGRYRYIRAPREELYDLEKDPAQRDNLAARAADDIPPVIDELRHELKRFGAGVVIPEPSRVTAAERQSLEALGTVGAGTRGPSGLGESDPKDKVAILEGYRAAVQLGAERRWAEAIDQLRTTVRADPGRIDLWAQLAAFAVRAGRDTQALSAYKQVLAIDPNNRAAHLGAARVLLTLHRPDEARQHAALVATEDPSPTATPEQISAHALLVEAALARRDQDTAREEAILVHEADSRMPMPDYVEARLLYDRGLLADAWPFFESAIAEAGATTGLAPIPELHYYAGDTLDRLKKYTEAEAALVDELKHYPHNNRARVALVGVYRKMGRTDDAVRTLETLIRISPTPDIYRQAAGMLKALGESRHAAAVRAEARRMFDEPRPANLSGQ